MVEPTASSGLKLRRIVSRAAMASSITPNPPGSLEINPISMEKASTRQEMAMSTRLGSSPRPTRMLNNAAPCDNQERTLRVRERLIEGNENALGLLSTHLCNCCENNLIFDQDSPTFICFKLEGSNFDEKDIARKRRRIAMKNGKKAGNASVPAVARAIMLKISEMRSMRCSESAVLRGSPLAWLSHTDLYDSLTRCAEAESTAPER